MKFPKLRKGRTPDSIVYDEQDLGKGFFASRPETLALYGGEVAAESVPPGFQPLFIAAPDLLEALQELAAIYKRIADSGDAGDWEAEEQPEYQKAMAAITKATQTT